MGRSIYYFPSWGIYQRNFQVKDIPASVNEIAYAFWSVKDDGTLYCLDTWADLEKNFDNNYNNDDLLKGNFGELAKIQRDRKLKVHLAIGGWTESRRFSSAMFTDASRQKFVSSILEFLQKYGSIFTGIVFDWEYPSNDGANLGNGGNESRVGDVDRFVIFLKLLRNSLKAKKMEHIEIGCCLSAAKSTIEAFGSNIKAVDSLIDLWHVMTYDFHGFAGETICTFHTNPRKSSYDGNSLSCEEAARFIVNKLGKSSSKKVMIGVAFYSRGFGNTDGPGKSGTAPSPDTGYENGVCDYKILPLPGATEFNDKESKACYSYDPVKRICNTYDNDVSILEKIKIVNEYSLGGFIVWDISGDKNGHLCNLIGKELIQSSTQEDEPTTQPSEPSQPSDPSQPPVVLTKCSFCKNCVRVVGTQPCELRTNLLSVYEWYPNTVYFEGQIVLYKGRKFRCLKLHTSTDQNVPSMTDDDEIWTKKLMK